MFKKIGQIIFFLVFVSAAALAQFSFLSSLPEFFGQINLVVIVLLFFLFFFDFRTAVWTALIAGFWLDLISFNFFGLYLIALFLTAACAHWLSVSWLTNRSLYSFLALILSATIVYNITKEILLSLSAYDQAAFFLVDGNFWRALAYQSAWSLIVALLTFNFAGILTRRLQPFFLEKKPLL
ncbi:TPA: hypothetical protein DCZ15_02615 [Candidatus Falkowbacteria bacterium]|nr:MAG: hypothetical protein UV95_C0001G0084 [Candidatus Falkowbacteria bacterium GW2011_GWF2_43_32]HBA36748.1 hypothetical protein [Candidatus Falkowbacteria bacterium]